MPAGFLIWICGVSTDLRLKKIVLPYIMNELSECLIIKITEKWDEVKIIYLWAFYNPFAKELVL